MKKDKFWINKKLTELSHSEWEALCDNCGKCCVIKLQNEKNNEILVTINEGFNQQDFQYIQQLSEIIEDSGEPAFHGELGNITVEIFETMNTYENELIIIEIQSGTYLGEDDIIRFEDKYRREFD